MRYIGIEPLKFDLKKSRIKILGSLASGETVRFNLTNLKSRKILGGYSGGAPPLPIPNREVKPASADGTA